MNKSNNGFQSPEKFITGITGSSPEWHKFYERVPGYKQKAFRIDSELKIPKFSSIHLAEDRQERMSSLLSVPKHKFGTTKFDKSQMNRSLVALT